jgi:hypothetical protein
MFGASLEDGDGAVAIGGGLLVGGVCGALGVGERIDGCGWAAAGWPVTGGVPGGADAAAQALP